MKKLGIALVGALRSLSVYAQGDAAVAGATLTTTIVTVAAPLALLTAVTVSAEQNDTPSAPQTAPSGTTSTR